MWRNVFLHKSHVSAIMVTNLCLLVKLHGLCYQYVNFYDVWNKCGVFYHNGVYVYSNNLLLNTNINV